MKTILSALTVSVICTIIWALSPLHFFILSLELFFLFHFLGRVGRHFVFLELLSLITVTQWLFGPLIAQRFGIKMDVPFDVYFAYAVPGTLIYLVGLTLPLWKQRTLDINHRYIFNSLTVYYRDKYYWGIALIMIGLPFWIFQNSVSTSLNFIFYLLSGLFMVGICLLMFTSNKWKWLWVGLGLFLLISTTFLNGMIGIVIIWMFIIGMIYTCKNPVHIYYPVKLTFFLVFVWLLIILQAAKTEYRTLTWNIKKNEMTSYVSRKIKQDPALFYKLIKEKMLDPKTLSEQSSMVALAGRLNEGYLVSLAMNYVPRKRAFGNGEVTLYNSAVAFVPRIFWKSKPVVGQAEYFKKYTGIQLSKFNSSTIGPLGDAYADFGKMGIVFLGVYGLMIGLLYQFWINKSIHHPSFFLWFVVMYFGTIAVTEVSVAGFINSILKYLIFIFVVRLLLRFVGIKV